MPSDNAYMAKYMKRRYHRRRRRAIRQLGGRCKRCGRRRGLEIDHVRPAAKKFVVSKVIAGASEARLQAELSKCQLLCHRCHILKSMRERGQKLARGTHGTLSSYRYCHCKRCRTAKRDYNRKYWQRHRASVT